jgi:hypothetical protein
MAESESGYKVGPGRPPLHTRFQKGQSGNPGGRAKSLPALLAHALNETVVMTIDGQRRKLTKREAIVTQMVDKSAPPVERETLVNFCHPFSFVAGLVPWAFSPRTWFRGHPRARLAEGDLRVAGMGVHHDKSAQWHLVRRRD